MRQAANGADLVLTRVVNATTMTTPFEKPLHLVYWGFIDVLVFLCHCWTFSLSHNRRIKEANEQSCGCIRHKRHA